MLVRDVGNYEVRYIGIAHSGDVGFGRFFVFIGMRVVDSQQFQPVLANLPRQVDDFFGGHFIARRWVSRYIFRWVGVGDLISAAGGGRARSLRAVWPNVFRLRQAPCKSIPRVFDSKICRWLTGSGGW